MAKRYTPEFRARAIQFCEDSDRPIAEVARELGVAYQTLYQWMLKAGKAGGRARVDQEPVEETKEEELRRVRRELEHVKLERDFLKKAAAFFARANK